MRSNYQSVLNNTEQALVENETVENPRDRSEKAIFIIENALGELRNDVIKNGFESDRDEIEFFKEIKPAVVSLEIQEGKKYSILCNKPIGTVDIQVKYFEDELSAIDRFFNSNVYYYQYYRNGLSTSDDIYFLRQSVTLQAPFPEIADTDTQFSTPVSSLFAKFDAYEKIQHFLLDQISMVKNASIMSNERIANPDDLKWTGDIVNIVELAYGLWLTGQLNDGNASLNQIVRWLEVNLHVSIGIIQRRFSEIERRKRLSVTKFLDQMKKSLEEKIERGIS